MAWLAIVIPAQVTKPSEQRTTETLAPGIEHLEIKRGDFDAEAGDRWQIHVLLVAPSKATLKLARAMDEIVGAETTSSMAARHSAIAAINAGYFRVAGTYRGEPNGTLALNGKVLSESYRQRASLAVSQAGGQMKAAFAHLEITAKLLVNGKTSHTVNGINRPREKDELIVFTPEFHRTTLTTPEGVEAVIRHGRVMVVKESGSQLIPNDGFVVSATGAAARWVKEHLPRGAKVTFKPQIRAHPALPFTPDFIIGGGPLLLAQGQVQTDTESFNPDSFYNFRHPRTAFGVRADGTLVLVTVDGRQPKKSVGMTIPELIALMQELGCRDAINLDGGGSTTMVIRNKVVNSVSDATGERPVSDALVVLPR